MGPYCYLCSEPAPDRVWVCRACTLRWHLHDWSAFRFSPRRMTLDAPYTIPEAYKQYALDPYYLLDEGL